MSTNKALGQHWLTDKATLKGIVELAQLAQTDIVLEIGPGLGSLTSHLLRQCSRVVAVEYDAQLAQHLRDSFAGSKLEVVQKDILDFDHTQLPEGFIIVANIPYYITGAILQKFCDSSTKPKKMVLLVQKEVAARLAVRPGQLSVLAISVQFWYDVALGPVVSSQFFSPPPAVDSQVVILRKLDQPRLSVPFDSFIRLVKAGFLNKRKTLGNSLTNLPRINKSNVNETIKSIGLSTNVRAQELTFKQWEMLHNKLLEEIGHG